MKRPERGIRAPAEGSLGNSEGQALRWARRGWLATSVPMRTAATRTRMARHPSPPVVGALVVRVSVDGGVTRGRGVPVMPSTWPVGWVDGWLLGAVEGAVDGSVLGAVDGAVEGAVLGAVLGAELGVVEGAVLGAVLGAVDGAVLGAVEGAVLGSVDGAVLGAVDGALLGSVEGGALGASAGQSMKSDFFVWTAALSTLLPKVRSLLGQGFVS